MSPTPDKPLEGREILLCVTGGIACYKSADLCSKLAQSGAGVHVAMTESARRFVAPLTFQAISRRMVYTDLWQSTREYRSGHLSLTEQADLMIVAPATANTLAKFSAGLADDLVSALALSAHGACPILLAPTMNTRMWEAPPTRTNLQTLRDWGLHVVGPNTGRLACDTVGPGRMAEPAEILAAAGDLLNT